MNTTLGSLLKVDISQVSPQVLEGLQTGKMILSASNGNVYWAAGSGNTGIVAQLPLIPVDPQELASAEQLLQLGQAVKGAQAAAVTATAVGTAVVVVAVVVATTYLAGKIKLVQDGVREIASAISQQDQREFLRHLSDYTGHVSAAQELLNARLAGKSLTDQATQDIARLRLARAQVLGYLRGLYQSASDPAKASAEQHGRILQFMCGMLDLVPAALTVERELCLAIGEPGLAEIPRRAASDFRASLAEFREWCEEQYRQVARGLSPHAEVLRQHIAPLRALFDSPVHAMLLDGFAGDFAKRAQPEATSVASSDTQAGRAAR